MEFLMGRSLKTSLLNLGLCGVADEVLRDYSMKQMCIRDRSGDPVPVLPRHHAGPRAPVTPSTGCLLYTSRCV